jgi:hypothetical protein
MPELDFRVDFDAEKAVAPVYGQPMVFHCHHYNTFLQQTIEDPDYVDGRGIMVQAARETAFEQLQEYFCQHAEVTQPGERLAIAADLFRTFGFGVLDFAPFLAGQRQVKAPHSHFAEGWLVKFGRRETPCCHFAAGYIAAALDAAYDRPLGHHKTSEAHCKAIAGDYCEFGVEV